MAGSRLLVAIYEVKAAKEALKVAIDKPKAATDESKTAR